jgi:hypothetical protein
MHFDCASAPGACAVGFMDNDPHSDFAPVGFPISFDPARPPSITVSPTAGLVAGQTIRVHGENLGEGRVEVDECLTLTWAACSFHEVTSAPDGSLDVSFPAQRDFTWGGHVSGSGSCDVDSACIIVVWVRSPTPDDDVTWSNWATPIVIHFATPPPSTTANSTTAVANLAEVSHAR